MSDIVSLIYDDRDRTGKGGARALRREGWLPAIIYGGKGEPKKVAVSAREVKRELEMNPRFFSSIVELHKDGKNKLRVLPREAQLHPVNDLPLHVDFIRVAKGATITVEIPVHFLNEDTCPGIKRGGVLNIVRREIELVCPIEHIPEGIEVDLGKCDIGDSIHISHVTLPDDVTPTITDRDFTICTVVGRGPAGDEDEDGEGAEEAEGGESSGGESEE
ncbi:MAG: 50S ribosomal protein L25/general stress protein Ctc [Geminicoccaceae bacterium]|nr:50S ribosomal protein L25/general stress protein Ctc [Geminicoccaceae bacterium]MCB2011196.1 50S ribosomal protein L25/general stress protein Ctc [Geminicoccaceae bacterium]